MIRIGWPDIMAAAEAALASDVDRQPTDTERRILRAMARGIATVLGSELHAPGEPPEAAFEEVALVNDDGATVTLEPSHAMSDDLTLTLPPNAGSAGQSLVTDGNGGLSWASGGAGVTSIGDGDGIDCTPNPITATGTIAVDTTVARRNAANTFTTGNQTMQALVLPEQGASPAAVANASVFYTLDQNGFTVAHIRDPDGTEYHLQWDFYFIARNVQGSAVTRGQPVYVFGATGQIPEVKLAKADDAATMPAIGVILDNVANNAFCRVMFHGQVDSLNTNAYAEGDLLYVDPSTAGTLTATEPAHPNLPQPVAVVTRQHLTQGSIFVSAGEMDGHSFGTNENTWTIGDTTAGTKTVAFAAAFTGNLSWAPTAARTLTLPDKTGTVATLDDTISLGMAVAVASLGIIR